MPSLKVVFLIDRTNLKTSRKKLAKPSHLTEHEVLFLMLAVLNVSIGMIELWFLCRSHTSMIRCQLWAFWANLGLSLAMFNSFWGPCDVVFAQNSTILEQSLLLYASSVKMAWHKPIDMLKSSATSLKRNRRLFKIIYFTASMFSSIFGVFGRPKRAFLWTYSRTSLNRL